MAFLGLAAFLLILFLLPATLVCSPLVWWQRSIGWRWWELVLPVAPFGLWLTLAIFDGKGKTFSNAVIEPLLCGCVAFIPIALRAVATRRGWNVKAAYFAGLAISCIFVLIIYAGMPSLAE